MDNTVPIDFKAKTYAPLMMVRMLPVVSRTSMPFAAAKRVPIKTAVPSAFQRCSLIDDAFESALACSKTYYPLPKLLEQRQHQRQQVACNLLISGCGSVRTVRLHHARNAVDVFE